MGKCRKLRKDRQVIRTVVGIFAAKKHESLSAKLSLPLFKHLNSKAKISTTSANISISIRNTL